MLSPPQKKRSSSSCHATKFVEPSGMTRSQCQDESSASKDQSVQSGTVLAPVTEGESKSCAPGVPGYLIPHEGGQHRHEAHCAQLTETQPNNSASSQESSHAKSSKRTGERIGMPRGTFLELTAQNPIPLFCIHFIHDLLKFPTASCLSPSLSPPPLISLSHFLFAL